MVYFQFYYEHLKHFEIIDWQIKSIEFVEWQETYGTILTIWQVAKIQWNMFLCNKVSAICDMFM